MDGTRFARHADLIDYHIVITSSDELYKQMLLNSSPEFSFFSSEEGNLRYVDFSERNPSPKILTIADYAKIMSSGCLFVRN